MKLCRHLLFTGTFSLMFLCSSCDELTGDPVPVQTYERNALLSSGKVVRVKNTSDASLRITFSALGKRSAVTLGPGESFSFGWAQGYDLADNTPYTISAPGYRSIKFGGVK